VRHGLATDETTLVEQPRVLPVELLERVVGEHDRVHAVGHLQDERVAASDHTRRRRDDLARLDALLERFALARVDAVRERRVDDDGDRLRRELAEERAHSVIELRQARQRSALGREVGAVDNDVVHGHSMNKSTRANAPTWGCDAFARRSWRASRRARHHARVAVARQRPRDRASK
jgi:hypothetical protein